MSSGTHQGPSGGRGPGRPRKSTSSRGPGRIGKSTSARTPRRPRGSRGSRGVSAHNAEVLIAPWLGSVAKIYNTIMSDSSGTFLTIDHTLLGTRGLEVYTPEKRRQVFEKIILEKPFSHKFVKTYFSWPFTLSEDNVTTNVASSGNTNDTIDANRKILPVFTNRTRSDELQNYFRWLRNELAQYVKVRFASLSDEEKFEYMSSVRKMFVSPEKLPASPLESQIQRVFYNIIAVPCKDFLTVLHGSIIDDLRSGINSAHKTDIVLCKESQVNEPLLLVEMKQPSISVFVQQDGSLLQTLTNDFPSDVEELMTIWEDQATSEGQPTETDTHSERGPSSRRVPAFSTVQAKFIKLFNQIVNYLINYKKKWCLVSDLRTTIYFEVDTESQLWKDLMSGNKTKMRDESIRGDTYIKLPFKYHVIRSDDTELTLQTIFASLLHRELSKRATSPADDDESDVADTLNDLVTLSGAELVNKFASFQYFYLNPEGSRGSNEGSNRHQGKYNTEYHRKLEDAWPKHVGDCDSLQYVPLQEGPKYLSQVLLFEAVELKRYVPTLNIPGSGKVVMKIYDEFRIQEHSASEYNYDQLTRAQCFRSASTRFIREVSSYKRISHSKITPNTPCLYDFGRVVVLEKSKLKFSGLFMVMSYVQPDPQGHLERTAIDDARSTIASLNSIGIEHNDLTRRNLVVSNSKVHIIDFSHAILDGDVTELSFDSLLDDDRNDEDSPTVVSEAASSRPHSRDMSNLNSLAKEGFFD